LEVFAQKCKIKKRTLSNRIEMLREFAAIEDAEIPYDRERKTYYFSPRGKFTDFKFKITVW
jgi:DNA-binding HxlR family transcriptional regulator